MGDNKIKKLHLVKKWEKTMPTINTKMIRKIREKQGVNGIFYAGDYTELPSMETAVYSGKKAADLVRKSF